MDSVRFLFIAAISYSKGLLEAMLPCGEEEFAWDVSIMYEGVLYCQITVLVKTWIAFPIWFLYLYTRTPWIVDP